MKGQSINEGDVLATYDGGEWRVSRILKVETESAIVHLMLYPTFSRKPTLDEVRNTTPFVWHVPVSLNDNPTHSEYIGNIPIVEGDLIGYADYVEATREFSANTEGESASTFTTETLELIQKAFDRGIKHHNKKQYDEAIASYSEVLALWPDYYEAIDNMAYVYMDMGQYDAAISLFHRSLEINPFGVTAHASLGDCHSQCGRYEEARLHYRDALTFAPGHRVLYKALNAMEKKLGLPLTHRPKKKSWWRFW